MRDDSARLARAASVPLIGALVLRPEPSAAATAAALRARGVDVLVQPLFAVTPVAWTAPDPAGFGALLLTSANAVRHAGPGLAALAALPVWAVGEATAAAARAAGLAVTRTGTVDAATLVAGSPPSRLLHLAGRDRVALPGVTAVTVYASDPVPLDPDPAWADRVALLHSARAARRFAALVEPACVTIATLSPAVRDAAGPGWGEVAVAAAPTDAALVAAAAALIDRAAAAPDNSPR